jgi:CRISPR-associated protein (TIGR02584 family)
MQDSLVTLCGLTPQVVTETLWALANRNPPIHPAEIWILTTQAGRTRCLRTLLGPKGALARYVREYRPRPAPRCTADHVMVLRAADGTPLDDVRSEQDHYAIGEQMAEFVRRHTERSDVRLHCSVAGGRKTMGVLLASTLQLYGRQEDRLYHVLVPPAFESLDTFFFPPKRPRALRGHDGRPVHTRAARIELAELPFVRLRGLLGPDVIQDGAGFIRLVEAAQRHLQLLLAPDTVRLERTQRRLVIGKQAVPLSPALFTIYQALARTKVRHCVRPSQATCGDCTDCYVPFTKGTWDQTKTLLEERGGGTILPLVKGPADAPEQFRSLVSKLNRKLDDSITLMGHENPYRIRSAGSKGETVYGLAIDKTKLVDG